MNKQRMIKGLIVILMAVLLISCYYAYQGALQVINGDNSQIEARTNKVIRYVRSHLVYAKDVTLRKKKPKGSKWESLYIKNGYLYHNKKLVFSKKWYGKQRLSIQFVAYIRSKTRIDFIYKLGTKDESYAKRQSLRLLKFDLVNSIDKDSPVAEERYDLSITNQKMNKKRLKLYYYN